MPILPSDYHLEHLRSIKYLQMSVNFEVFTQVQISGCSGE